MFISIEQIKAARALLKWTQKDLAAYAGLNDDQVHSFESGRTRSLEVLEGIYRALTSHGIEFVDGGVKPHHNRVTTFQGREGFAAFRLDVLEEAKAEALQICVNNVDEREFEKWGRGKVNDEYIAEMEKLKGLDFRILVKENDTYLTGSKYARYRWLPENVFGEISFYVYGRKMAIISFEDDDFNAFSISHERISNFYRKEFDRLWDQAYELKDVPSKSKDLS